MRHNMHIKEKIILWKESKEDMRTLLKNKIATIFMVGATLTTLTGCSQEETTELISDLIVSGLEYSLTQQDQTNQTMQIVEEPEITGQSQSENTNTTSISLEENQQSQQSQQAIPYEYYYNQLTDIQKNIYNQLYKTVETVSESTAISLNSVTQDEISLIFRALRYDHPEIYWIQAYKYIIDEKGNQLYFYPTYLVNAEEKSLYDEQLSEWTEKALSTVNSEMTTYEKEKAIYDFIVDNTEYSLDSELNQSLISVVKGKSVCLGYTKAMKYCCDKINIPCVVIEGTSKDGVAHSWNKVQINDAWYNVDATNSNTAQMFSNSYDMFNITDELISIQYTETQIGEESTSGESSIEFEYPIANSIEADYYKMKGLYINSLNEIETVVNNHIKEGTITIRLSPECSMGDELKEYIKNLEITDSKGNAINIKCVNYITINYIRLIEINWTV